MILLWGLSADSPLAAVRKQLDRRRVPYVFIDQHETLETEVELQVGEGIAGVVRTPGSVLDLGEVTAVYLRPHDSRELAAVRQAGEHSLAWTQASQVEDILLSWSELTSALVINRPSAMGSNSSKPFQSAVISAHGFDVPDTLITTEPEAVKAFCAGYEAVVYKSLSSVRSIVARLDYADQERMKDVAWCPTQFQEYIPGEDCRVHVIGDEIFACRIVSEADDYRYASRQGMPVNIRACEIPANVAVRCKSLAADLGLAFVGIDLRQRSDGRWYCFEVNPSPGFTYYENFTGQPIAATVARLLSSAPRNKSYG
jgi:RimK-like ATP-grasp domain